MVIDAHAHIMTGSYEQDKHDILKAVEMYNISRVYVSAIDGGQFYPSPEEIEGYNAEMHSFARQYRGLIYGYCYVNPAHANTSEVIRRGIEDCGFAGVKLWVSHHCDNPQVFPVIEQCIGYNVPVLVHAFHKAVGQLPNETTGVHVAALARRYPQAKLLMAHLGANCYHGIKAVRNCPNVMVDFSGSLFRRDDIDYTVEMIGAERILFGTDMPQPGSYLSNLGRVLEAELSDMQRDMILCKNALRLFDGTEG